MGLWQSSRTWQKLMMTWTLLLASELLVTHCMHCTYEARGPKESSNPATCLFGFFLPRCDLLSSLKLLPLTHTHRKHTGGIRTRWGTSKWVQKSYQSLETTKSFPNSFWEQWIKALFAATFRGISLPAANDFSDGKLHRYRFWMQRFTASRWRPRLHFPLTLLLINQQTFIRHFTGICTHTKGWAADLLRYQITPQEDYQYN